MNLAEKYLIEALDAYPYNLTEVMEALHYALSYDEENAMVHCLLGQVYAEQLQNYALAIEHFEQALFLNNTTFRAYGPYISTLIEIEEMDKAEEIIAYALTLKGSDKALMWLKRAIIEESRLNFELALEHIKMAKNCSLETFKINHINEVKNRIKDKMPKKKKKSKKLDKVKTAKKAA